MEGASGAVPTHRTKLSDVISILTRLYMGIHLPVLWNMNALALPTNTVRQEVVELLDIAAGKARGKFPGLPSWTPGICNLARMARHSITYLQLARLQLTRFQLTHLQLVN
jgi:hypothetical protein